MEATCDVIEGDSRLAMATLGAGSFDAVICDPPYELGFMGKAWDKSGVAFRPETWAAVLRVLRPGGYMLAMGGPRTYHRLTCAVEGGGFEIRDCLMWLYGTGFPKGNGCLKPAYEPIVLARKPGPKVLPLGIDECRVGTSKRVPGSVSTKALRGFGERPGRKGETGDEAGHDPDVGRYPANVLHDGSDDVMEAFAAFGESKPRPGRFGVKGGESPLFMSRGDGSGATRTGHWPEDSGGTAARFFYCAKASKAERGEGNAHPTVKPLSLMRWLVRLACPPGGRILDPFAGSGTAGVAALLEGRSAVLIERSPEYAAVARRRIAERK